ncbi:MAG: hypothetical protein LBS42_09370 [Tannerella sp.]|jgi:hypothetical protein|nr:hypothetical protein [Tannerella sp.]
MFAAKRPASIEGYYQTCFSFTACSSFLPLPKTKATSIGTGDKPITALAFDNDFHPKGTAANTVAAELANFPANFPDGRSDY